MDGAVGGEEVLAALAAGLAQLGERLDGHGAGRADQREHVGAVVADEVGGHVLWWISENCFSFIGAEKKKLLQERI